MSKSFDQGREEIAKLCKYFANSRQEYLKPGIKEAHVRQSLIDPLFEALGWDVANREMAAPQYREVIPEDSLEIEGSQKAPDYTFRIGSYPKFFTEAKKCGVNINGDPGPAYQLRRYGWSAKVPFSILTDFEELGVYDCSLKPKPVDKAGFGRIQYFRSEEYPDRWHELWDVFSREAVKGGAFDKLAATKRKRGTSEVDDEFLKEIEGWRDALARNIAVRNQFLAPDDLNTAVQRTIDRIIFLRMAEDRGSEPYGQLLKLCEQPDVYKRFISKLCRIADEKYNSGLFHFKNEEGIAEGPDLIATKIQVDDKVFKPILQNLYFENGSPYHFGVMPVEMLGTVYERFLGKVIRLTPDHRAKVEEKPEVRKAGGVYYTPAYIVNYIVKNTVGKLIEGKSPAQLVGGKNGQPIRVLDMACGSGSFLLGAFQCLLDHCLKWYSENHPEKYKNEVYRTSKGEWRLAIAEKKRILTTHIFGVDIDPQAVEVSKLSLLLKVMEGETDETVGTSRMLFHQRALPNLSANIKCGNSLIGPGYFTGNLLPDADAMKRINPFDWKHEFPEVMKAGGFDIIIGNPPYIRIQTMNEWAPLEVEIYKELFRAGQTGNYDIYVVFVEKALDLLNRSGRLGFILPHKFFNAQYGEALRGIIANGKNLAHIVHFGDQQIFTGATTYTCLLFLDKAGASECHFARATDLDAWRVKGKVTEGRILAKTITAAEWNFVVGDCVEVLNRAHAIKTKLGDTAHIFQGLVTGADKVFVVPTDADIECGLTKPFLLTGDLKAYATPIPSARIIFPYKISNGKAELIPAGTLKKEFPKGWAYLSEHREMLMNRERGKWHHERWYAFGRSQNLTQMDAAKLVIQVTAQRPTVLYDDCGLYMTGGGSGPFYGIRPKGSALSIKYLLGILNSLLFGTIIQAQSTNLRGGYIKFSKQYIEKAPIATPDKTAHDRIIKLVESMLILYKQLSSAKGEAEREVLQRQISATNHEIDRLVYELYGLTEEEIKIVEEAHK